ncbi:MAG: transporter substrate-binding domain-containing protein [Peptococcaceae bacterium]|nr:transporter substrate-binding domain-containing protein [Peptococcaceae bacterium]
MKLKKLVAVTLAAVLALGVVGCGSGEDDTTSAASDTNVTKIEAKNPWEATVKGDGSLDRVKEAGVIKAGLDDSYPPMGYHDAETDEIVGFDVDMANAIGEKLGVKFEFVPAEWNAIIAGLQTGKFDVIISGMNMWDSRVKEANYVPYGVADQYLLVLNENVEDGMDDIEYYKDKVIGTQLGSTAANDLLAAGFVEGENMKVYKTFPEITVDLDNGRIDALAIDSFGSVELLETGKYTHVGDVPSSEGKTANQIGIAFNKEDGDLQLAIQKAVDELLVDGTMKEISMKWIGMDITESLVADAQARLDANEY